MSDIADPLAQLESLTPENWLDMGQADATLIAMIVGSPYVMTDAQRLDTVAAAKRLLLYTYWARSHIGALRLSGSLRGQVGLDQSHS